MLDELTAVEIELARAQLDQIRSETRQANALWTSYCLKRVVFWGIVLWLLTTFAGAAQAQSSTRSFYDGQGRFAGSSVTRGNSSSFYDGRGWFPVARCGHGKFKNKFYDRQGRYSGTVIDTGPRR